MNRFNECVSVKSFASLSILHADGRHMLLGGQHISAACFWMRNKLLSDNPGRTEETLPLAYQVVRAVVMKSDAPRRALISAAGYHQSIQHDSQAPLMTDVMRMIGRYCAEKQNRSGSPQLTDDELANCLQAIGLMSGSREVLGQAHVDLTQDEAMKLEEKVVCACAQCGFEWVCECRNGRFLCAPFLQRYNLIQLWRSTCRFVEANLHPLPALLTKLDVLNRSDTLDNAPFRPQLLRENPGLLIEDYQDMGTWLLELQRTNYKELNSYLLEARKRRMARWHVYGAPDDVILPELSMCRTVLLWIVFVFFST